MVFGLALTCMEMALMCEVYINKNEGKPNQSLARGK